MANQPVANLINVRVQNACKFVYKFASSLPIRKFSANSVLNLHTCKRICKFVGNPKLANKGIATVQTNSKFSSISLQRICITCNFLANPTFRPVEDLGVSSSARSILRMSAAVAGGSLLVKFLQKKDYVPAEPFKKGS